MASSNRDEWEAMVAARDRQETQSVEDVEEPAVPVPEHDSSDEWLKTQSQLENGVNWFNWIAALSLINVVIFLAGSDTAFVVGLGITQFITGLAEAVALQNVELAWIAKGIALALAVGIAGLFAGFAWLGKRRHVWAIALGMLLYLFDGLLFVLIGDWLSVGFHGFALFCLFGGITAAVKLNAWARQSAVMEYAT